MRKLLLLVTLAASMQAQRVAPAADHHMHVLSPAAAASNSETPLAAVAVPDGVAQLLRDRVSRWNDAKSLGELYLEDSFVLDAEDAAWLRGPARGAGFLARRVSAAYDIVPVQWREHGASGWLAGYYTQGTRYVGHVLLTLAKNADGAWRIAAEVPVMKGPWTREALTTEQLIAQLDEAGIAKGAVLSVAYWFRADYAKVKAENDWMAAQVARYPERLVGFCGLHPLQDYAIAELDRCAAMPHVRGIKMQFGNSRVDLRNAEHIEKLRRLFRAANDRRMAIVAHLWKPGGYGRPDAEAFLTQLLPVTPDVPVQIAHFAGGGPGYTDEALAVFAEAIEKGDPRTKNLWFDLATVADQQSNEELAQLAKRIRQVGLKRVLYGTDSSPPNPTPRQGWGNFRISVPLTEEELKAIARNVAPYFDDDRRPPAAGPTGPDPSGRPSLRDTSP